LDNNPRKYNIPLAERFRPRDFSEFKGQEHILAPDKLLRRSIEQDNMPSFILWGPPGSGKTTLSRIIKNKTSAHFVTLAAVTSGVRDVREVIKEAEIRRKTLLQKTILFIDEIHRFNKAQQDAFLPYVEKGTITLIGATTENPYFEVISALLSRARVYRLNPLTDGHLRNIINAAVNDTERGIGELNVRLEDEALELLLNSAGGDARIALNALETAALVITPDKDGVRVISPAHIYDALQQKKSIYDKAGDAHYDIISAFIKSVRGSDPDAAIYYLARMLYNGEDPKFVARRLIILASEDIGLADPFALNIANAAAMAVQYIGMPEARITLAEATVYLACAPKSNTAYKAIESAIQLVTEGANGTVPLHLRNPAAKGLKQFGYGKDYKYAHDFPGHFVRQQFMPEELKEKRFYYPGNLGHEIKIKERLKKWWGERFVGDAATGDGGQTAEDTRHGT